MMKKLFHQNNNNNPRNASPTFTQFTCRIIALTHLIIQPLSYNNFGQLTGDAHCPYKYNPTCAFKDVYASHLCIPPRTLVAPMIHQPSLELDGDERFVNRPRADDAERRGGARLIECDFAWGRGEHEWRARHKWRV